MTEVSSGRQGADRRAQQQCGEQYRDSQSGENTKQSFPEKRKQGAAPLQALLYEVAANNEEAADTYFRKLTAGITQHRVQAGSTQKNIAMCKDDKGSKKEPEEVEIVVMGRGGCQDGGNVVLILSGIKDIDFSHSIDLKTDELFCPIDIDYLLLHNIINFIPMKRNLMLLLLLLTTSICRAQIPGLQWAKQINEGTPAPVLGLGNGHIVAVDHSGNVYTLGKFSGTVDFDPGAAVYNLTATGPEDMYICKLDAAGNFVWARSIAGASPAAVKSKASGNICIAGNFSGIVDFNPDSGIFNLTASDATDIFLCELDTSGALVWAKSMGGAGDESASAMVLDGNENIYLTGNFSGTADFDPGSGVSTLTSTGMNAFVCKLDAAGNFAWAKKTGQGGFAAGHGIAVDGLGNVYTTGSYFGTADFDPGVATYNLTAAGARDIFVSKLDATGNFIWAKGMGGSDGNIDGVDEGIAIAAGASGDVYIAGYYSSTTDFDPGPGVSTMPPSYIATALGFLLKLDDSGNFHWVKGFGGFTPLFQQMNAIALDAAENVYVTGWVGNVGGTMTHDPTMLQVYVAKFGASGNNKWYITTGSPGYDISHSIVLNASGDIYVVGAFSGTTDFDPGNAQFNLTADPDSDRSDAFVWKMNELCVATSSIHTASTTSDSYSFNDSIYTTSGTYTQLYVNAAGCDSLVVLHLTFSGNTAIGNSAATGNWCVISPNPAAGESFTLSSANELHNASVRLASFTGQVLDSRQFSGRTFNFPLSGIAAGVYMVEVIHGKAVYRSKIIRK